MVKVLLFAFVFVGLTEGTPTRSTKLSSSLSKSKPPPKPSPRPNLRLPSPALAPSNELWRLVCGREKLSVANIRVSVIEINNWRVIETKTTDDHGRVTLATRPYKDGKSVNEDFIVKVFYNYEPVVGQGGDESPFSVSHENETINEESALTEEILLDDETRRTGGGNLTLTDSPCLAFVNTKRALEDFRAATGRRGHPAGALRLVFSKHIGDTLGVPFTTADTILLPAGYRMTYSSALREIGLSLRYALDGSYAHFLGDLAKYSYTQPHSCKQRTNRGLAFSQGWASYWADATNCFVGSSGQQSKPLLKQRLPPTDEGDAADDEFSIEGRVAAALKELGVRCHGLRDHRRRFYELLERNPLVIHSYKEFVVLHRKKYNCGG